MKEQVKPKQRVADHAEVFTHQQEIKAMFDLVKQETELAVPSRCGSEG
jgi:hypothetical protein